MLIELREDIVAAEEDRIRTAALLADALRPILFDPGLPRITVRGLSHGEEG